MEQLPGGDAVFLALETPNAPGHVGGLTVLDPSESPDFSLERLREVIGERIQLEPRFTRKLREVSLGLDRPYLVDDPDFDVSNHVRRIAVPAPGGMRELAELAGFLHARALDRDRPLWELWLIEGVENDRVAMFMKSHHCLMDGQSGAGLGELLCDLEPNPEGGPILPPKPEPVDEDLSDLQVALRAAGNLATTPIRMARFSARMLRSTAAMLLSSVNEPEAPPLPNALPRVSFNRDVGPRRGFACTSVSLSDGKSGKKHFEVTVNDVVLALTGSTLRRYLADRDELPEASLVAMIAVSTRSEGDGDVGNQITTVPVSWATHLEDPLERLLQIHRNANKSKELVEKYDADMMAGLGDAMPPGLMNFYLRNASGVAAQMVPGNVVVSNVRGTPVPLYTAGARIECMYPMSMLAPGQGLNITAVSYMDRIDIGFTVDPDLVPDAWALADAVQPGLDELLRAAEERVQDAA
jgi:WS/DGAT/MGAT family acyltransferase